MERNVGSTDRYVRIALGIVLGAVGIAAFTDVLGGVGRVGGAIALVLGVVMLGTGMSRTCLLYKPLGIDTGR